MDNLSDEEDEEEADGEEGGGLSKSGKELKKLLGRTSGLNDSDAEDDDDDDDVEDESSPVLAPRKEAVKDEAVDNSPSKPAVTGSARGTPSTSKSAKGKRKINGDDTKATNAAPSKKAKTENEVKPVKAEPVPASKGNVPAKGASSLPKPAPTPLTGPVTEDEIRAVLMQKGPVTTQDLVAQFKARLKCKEDKDAFAGILRRISKIQKTSGSNFVVLREK